MSRLLKLNFLNQLLSRLRHDTTGALEECQEEYAKFEASHELATYEMIGFLCAYVDEVKKSPEGTKELVSHKRWPKHKPKLDNITLAATRFAMNAWETKTDLYERARIYSKVIDHYLETRVEPEDVPHKLAKTKISGVLNKLAEQNQPPAPAPSGKLARRTSVAVPELSQRSETVSSPVLLRQRESGRSSVSEAHDTERVRDDDDLVPRHRNFDDAGLEDNDDEVLSRRRKKVMIDENEEIVISAGRHFAKFGEAEEDDEIVVRMRRLRDRDGWWQFRVIEARIEPDDGAIKLIH